MAEAFAPLEDENKATAELGEIIRGTQERAADIAAMGPDLAPPDPSSRRVSYRRRWLLGTLGFFIALYNVVGSTASIVSTPTGAAFYKALGDAIQLLMKLLF